MAGAQRRKVTDALLVRPRLSIATTCNLLRPIRRPVTGTQTEKCFLVVRLISLLPRYTDTLRSARELGMSKFALKPRFVQRLLIGGWPFPLPPGIFVMRTAGAPGTGFPPPPP